jgi:hypothetical protein
MYHTPALYMFQEIQICVTAMAAPPASQGTKKKLIKSREIIKEKQNN